MVYTVCTLTFVGLGASRSNLMPFWTNIIYDGECTYNEMQLRCIFMKCPLCTDRVDRKLNCFSFSVWIWIWVVDPSAKRSSCFSFSFPFFPPPFIRSIGFYVIGLEILNVREWCSRIDWCINPMPPSILHLPHRGLIAYYKNKHTESGK